MSAYYTREDVVKLLKSRQGSKTLADFSDEIGISFQLLSAVFNGTRQPNGKLLKFLKLRKATVYTKA